MAERIAAEPAVETASVAFDNEKYLSEQQAAILARVERFHNKLYLEFGGKLLYDYHAARVLPGYDPNVKMRLLAALKDDADIVLCIYARDIERKKVRADFGITYDSDAFKLIDDLREWGLDVAGVVITRFEGQTGALAFKNKLERRGVRTYTHGPIRGYPANVELIVSENGYGANEYIETTKPLVVVTGPGPNSGKMATCLSQVYHDYRRGLEAGYAKFETFPIWNLPLRHPVNLAYEAATADIGDWNILDPFHLEVHGVQAVNYNRDVESFAVLKAILEKITRARSAYRSPTEMGVNRAGFAILDDALVREAAGQEIIRRHYRYSCEYAMGLSGKETVDRVDVLMKELELSPLSRRVVLPAREAAASAQREGRKGNKGIYVGAAVELRDGRIVTGTNSPILHAASSLVLNAVKELAGIPASLRLLSPSVIEAVATLKQEILQRGTVSLDLEETMIAISICSTTNPAAKLAMEYLKGLRGCEVHMTHIPSPGDETGLRRLGVNLTCEPIFATKSLFMS